MPFCSKCGNEIAENVNFCQKCGNATQGERITNQSGNAVENTGVENLSLWGYFLKCFKNYANFNGRARRKEYWGFVLFCPIISFALVFIGAFVGGILGDEEGVFGVVLSYLCPIAVALPGLAVYIRRLHDTGRSGWYILMSLIPLIGAFFAIYYTVIEGEAKKNEYGPPTKTNMYSDSSNIFQ